MKLREWFDANDIEIKRFAYENEMTQASIYNWLKGRSKPARYHQKLLHTLTKGKVTYEDWNTKNDKRSRGSKDTGLHSTKRLANDKANVIKK